MGLLTFARVGLAAALAFAALPADATEPGAYDALYVFGDSLVDAGNISTFTHGATPNQALGYKNGRFTNGYDYTDYINYELFGTPTKPSLLGGNNYAFGGARIVTDATDTIPDIAPQVGLYAAQHGGAADPDALYILNAGGNDIFALEKFEGGNANALLPYTDVADYTNAIVDTYAGAVQQLNDLGARNILIAGIPVATDPQSFTIEGLLQAKLDTLSLDPGTALFRFSYLDFFNRVQTDPASLGLPVLNFDSNCIAAHAQLIDCGNYFSFDGTHPTAIVQQALFRDIVRQFAVSPVPEPHVWLLMLGGFALAGGAIRVRQRKLAAA